LKKGGKVLEIQRLRAIAIARGFGNEEVSLDGTAIWLRRTDAVKNGAQLRMCIDAVTQSVTVFWDKETTRASKTFRKSVEMDAWLRFTLAT
jgi:hypothetical protein